MAVVMTRAEKAAYQRQWRERNPTYNREYKKTWRTAETIKRFDPHADTGSSVRGLLTAWGITGSSVATHRPLYL